jgi:hypothetical protein
LACTENGTQPDRHTHDLDIWADINSKSVFIDAVQNAASNNTLYYDGPVFMDTDQNQIESFINVF